MVWFWMTSTEVKRAEEQDVSRIISPEMRQASWLSFLAIIVSILILWGGIVRLSGSGLSIPEWPVINRSLLPPLSEKDWIQVYHTYQQEVTNLTDPQASVEIPLGKFKLMFVIEYVHRFLASIVGIVFLAIFVRSLRIPRVWQQTKWLLFSSLLLLLLQAGLGGVVVKQDLKAELVAGHLGLAFLFLGTVLWAVLKLSVPQVEGKFASSGKLSLLSWIVTGFVFIQIISGGLMAGTKAGVIFNTFPKMGDYLLPPFSVLWSSIYEKPWHNLIQNQVLIQFFHRWWAFMALLSVLVLIVYVWKAPLTPRARLAARAIGTVTVFQVLLGILNLLLQAPFWVSLLHLATGLLLFSLLILITHEVKYLYETV